MSNKENKLSYALKKTNESESYRESSLFPISVIEEDQEQENDEEADAQDDDDPEIMDEIMDDL
jgi:hypothetical protein